MLVELSHLLFQIKIACPAQASDDYIKSVFVHKICQQAVAHIYLDIGNTSCSFRYHFHPFFKCEHGLFFKINDYTYDKLVEYIGCPLDNIKMSESKRIEGSGIQGFYLHKQTSEFYAIYFST